MNALATRFSKKCSPIYAYAFQATAVVEPCDSGCQSKQNLKPSSPRFPLQRQKAELRCPQPICVKIDMPRFVTQNPVTNLLENRIMRARTKEPVICRPDQFRNDQHLQLKIQTEGPTNESINKMPEQSGMFLLFRNEEFQRFVIGCIVWDLSRRAREQKIALTTFTQLKVRQRARKRTLR
jgi:hypothetical protein